MNVRAYTCAVSIAVLAVACAGEEEQVFEKARRTGEAAGYAEGKTLGFEQGYAEGLDVGRAEGRAQGRNAALGRWMPIGLAVGIVLGFLFVLLVRREALMAELGRRRREAALRRAIGRLPAGLSEKAMGRFEEVARARVALHAALEAAGGGDTAELENRLAPRLDRLGDSVVALAALIEQLEHAQRDTPDASHLEDRLQRRLAWVEASESAAEPETAPEVRVVIDAEQRSLDARRRVDTELDRCHLELDALLAFLSHARISVATVQAAAGETPALYAELSRELDALERNVRTAGAELAEL